MPSADVVDDSGVGVGSWEGMGSEVPGPLDGGESDGFSFGSGSGSGFGSGSGSGFGSGSGSGSGDGEGSAEEDGSGVGPRSSALAEYPPVTNALISNAGVTTARR
jgi:hypothetical protein